MGGADLRNHRLGAILDQSWNLEAVRRLEETCKEKLGSHQSANGAQESTAKSIAREGRLGIQACDALPVIERYLNATSVEVGEKGLHDIDGDVGDVYLGDLRNQCRSQVGHLRVKSKNTCSF